MSPKSSTLYIIPVLASSDIMRDIGWHEVHTGFVYSFGDKGYAGLVRDNLEFHLQFHSGTKDDPVQPGVMKIFVSDIDPYVKEFIRRGTIKIGDLRTDTPWGTHEFGFYDSNKNAIFFVQDV